MTILAWIVLAVVLLAVCLLIYACCVKSGEADERAEKEFLEWQNTQRRYCPTCAHHLGGGLCRQNLERECGDGGYEAWQPKTKS